MHFVVFLFCYLFFFLRIFFLFLSLVLVLFLSLYSPRAGQIVNGESEWSEHVNATTNE